ncbi:unnamed protein product [Urochloa decumbens]|uniref:Uncharacterized protein n=1 Tax=Urochloa decumbens TaxID=240449 RepID=A0ABC8Z7T5_9POAL
MAADGTQLLRGSDFGFTFTIDGAITTVLADDPVEKELARRRDRGAAKRRDGDEAKKGGSGAAKKRGRDGSVDRREETEAASGWSSAVVERGLALRRRGGSATCSSRRCGLIVGEGARDREETAASGIGGCGIGAGAAAAADQEPLVDPALAFLCVAVL